MNLTKLFNDQKVVRAKIIETHNLEGLDLLPNLILALQVELGELANEWRGFKHWSNDCKPRYHRKEWKIIKDVQIKNELITNMDAEINYAAVELVESKPLLEEYADCLAFILEIGLELRFEINENDLDYVKDERLSNITVMFLQIGADVIDFYWGIHYGQFNVNDYEILLAHFLELGRTLDFTEQEIEQAYYEKHAINLYRQESGY